MFLIIRIVYQFILHGTSSFTRHLSAIMTANSRGFDEVQAFLSRILIKCTEKDKEFSYKKYDALLRFSQCLMVLRHCRIICNVPPKNILQITMLQLCSFRRTVSSKPGENKRNSIHNWEQNISNLFTTPLEVYLRIKFTMGYRMTTVIFTRYKPCTTHLRLQFSRMFIFWALWTKHSGTRFRMTKRQPWLYLNCHF